MLVPAITFFLSSSCCLHTKDWWPQLGVEVLGNSLKWDKEGKISARGRVVETGLLVAHEHKRKNTNVERYKFPKETNQNQTREENQVSQASPGHLDDLMMSVELVGDLEPHQCLTRVPQTPPLHSCRGYASA